MIDQYVLATNDDGDLAIRTVSATESSSVTDTTSVITATDDGKLAVRVVGGGGGDQHNLGYYATPQALNEAHATAEAGDWAIVGSTDTVWIWDTDTSAWVDSDQKGQVTSVNGQTGAVTVQETLINQTNIKSVDGNSLLGSGNLELSTYLTYPAGWTTTGTTKALCDDIAADTNATKGKAYLGEVTCSDLPASMANGEVVVEIMDGTTAANKVIVLTLTSGNTAPYMWKYTYWNGGTDVSGWQTWATSAQGAKADTAVQPGDLATVATTGAYSDLTGKPTIPAAIQVSTMPTAAVGELGNIYQFVGTTDANYTNGYFYKCVSDGQDPATYSWTQTDVQPQAGGLPDQTGQSGKFLTTDGTDASWATINALQNTATGSSSLTVSGTATATVATTNLGVGSSCEATGGVALGYESKIQNSSSNFSTAVGRSATVTNANCTAVGAYSGSSSNYIGNIVAVGYMARAEANGTVTIGTSSTCGASATRAVIVGTESSSYGTRGIAIGYKVTANAAGAIQIGSNGSSNAWHMNSTPETLKVGNVNGNFEMMSADGTIPTDRFTTTPSADGTYVPTLTISSGTATRTWGAAASAPVVPATAPTLVVADWSSNTQTITVSGVTSSNVVLVGPAPSSAQDYADAGILCTAQGTDSLTFTCTTVPSNAITLSVVIFG